MPPLPLTPAFLVLLLRTRPAALVTAMLLATLLPPLRRFGAAPWAWRGRVAPPHLEAWLPYVPWGPRLQLLPVVRGPLLLLMEPRSPRHLGPPMPPRLVLMPLPLGGRGLELLGSPPPYRAIDAVPLLLPLRLPKMLALW